VSNDAVPASTSRNVPDEQWSPDCAPAALALTPAIARRRGPRPFQISSDYRYLKYRRIILVLTIWIHSIPDHKHEMIKVIGMNEADDSFSAGA
jgi:hypothetical protein